MRRDEERAALLEKGSARDVRRSMLALMVATGLAAGLGCYMVGYYVGFRVQVDYCIRDLDDNGVIDGSAPRGR